MIKEKAAYGGAIFAAFVSSLCCITPLLFVLFGVGSFGMATMFEPLRPYLMGGAVLLLAVAYYRVYFKREAPACAPGEACETKPISRASRFGLWFATLAVILFALVPYITAPLAARLSSKQTTAPKTDDCCVANKSPNTSDAINAQNQSPANTKQVTFTVKGMTCASCEPAIRLALEKTPGVKRADVSYERGNAIVDYDPKVTTPEKLRNIINGTGYKVKE